jgi:hypothetical protein
LRAGDEQTNAAAKQVLATMPRQNNDLPRALTVPVPTRKPNAAPRISRIIQLLLTGTSSTRLVTVEMRIRMEQRLAAVALAIRMHRVDHGDLPASLDALVPNYLPRVPKDPFATDARIGYMRIKHGLPDGTDRPLIYSVGEAGDVDVEEKYAPPVPTFDWSKGNFQFRDLTRWSPAATTQPAAQ